jgi:hypothetical protein
MGHVHQGSGRHLLQNRYNCVSTSYNHFPCKVRLKISSNLKIKAYSFNLLGLLLQKIQLTGSQYWIYCTISQALCWF